MAGRIGLENYKSLLDMVDVFKKTPGNGTKTVMVFPGVTKAYTTIDQAKAYLMQNQADGLIPVIFKFNGSALDVKKLLGDDTAASTAHLPDGLLQRFSA
jgi:hypothetical protein